MPSRIEISRSDRAVIRITQIFLGVVCLFISAAATIQTFNYQTHGVRAQADVLEMVLAKDYRTTNFRRSVDYYKAKVLIVNRQGTNETLSMHLHLADKKKFNVAVGSNIPVAYNPGSGIGMIATNLLDWKTCIIVNAIFIPLAIFLIVLATKARRSFHDIPY